MKHFHVDHSFQTYSPQDSSALSQMDVLRQRAQSTSWQAGERWTRDEWSGGGDQRWMIRWRHQNADPDMDGKIYTRFAFSFVKSWHWIRVVTDGLLLLVIFLNPLLPSVRYLGIFCNARHLPLLVWVHLLIRSSSNDTIFCKKDTGILTF